MDNKKLIKIAKALFKEYGEDEGTELYAELIFELQMKELIINDKLKKSQSGLKNPLSDKEVH